jgi:hypothetical protein
LGTLVTVSGA